ncbi:TolC family protein [Rhodohalobacter sp. 8-1]|uniref:TolC family protein n=1 Tax=Rhodohalobacter sp. 8-1 TaxID=3131972 RepID=UPI0030EF0E95
MRFLIFSFILAIMAGSVSAQQQFTLDEAIKAALEHNHSVEISNIETDIAENSVSRGNAGQLPNLAITGGLSASYTDLDITPGSFFRNLLDPQNSGQQVGSRSISYDGVTTTQFSSQIGTQIVIYNGMRGRLRYKMLETGSDLADLQYRSELETTILNITAQFIRVASFQKAIEVKEISLEQSNDRFRAIETRREYGQVNEQQLLQALADLKSDSTAYRNLKLQYETAYRDLHTEIGWDQRKMDNVADEFNAADLPNYEDFLALMMENNSVLNIREKRLAQAELNERVTRAGFLPSLTATAGYGYSYTNATEGQFETQEQLGFSGGITLKIPIFSGGRNRIESQNAKDRIRQEELRREESAIQLQTRFENSWQQYLHLQNQLETERSNLSVYERNYERAKVTFDRGEITGVELRAAQLSLENARLRVAETGFQLKQTETLLRYLTGTFITDYSH